MTAVIEEKNVKQKHNLSPFHFPYSAATALTGTIIGVIVVASIAKEFNQDWDKSSSKSRNYFLNKITQIILKMK